MNDLQPGDRIEIVFVDAPGQSARATVNRVLSDQQFANCWVVHSAGGCCVKLQSKIRREPISIATNRYSTWNVTVTKMKKSQATVAFA
ncbi:MAG TPA: hypothetical protein VGN17_02510 [Bryobacteraceae bacterium]|jgi:protein involved in polysaccharide export with SLBB domain